MPGTKEIHSTIDPDAVTQVISTALVNARKRGELWQSLGEEFLGTTEQVLKNLQQMRLNALRLEATPAREIAEMNDKVLDIFERLADAVWVERGESAQDPYISILSPGTPSFFFDWAIGRPADRLELLLELFTHSGTPETQSSEVTQILAEIQGILPELRRKTDAVHVFRAKLEALEKLTEFIARVGHVQYSRLRRRMRTEGFDAFEVRMVFPDIPGTSMAGTLG
ncbi:MAG TPA: hypothetical protein PK156_24890 [Polyangium sp.]|nr:hypothetical protein [Polyangium sp.]